MELSQDTRNILGLQLPTDPIWTTLQRLRSPAAKMSPFVLYDRETGRTKLYADLDKLEILIPDTDPEASGLMKSIPYLNLPRISKPSNHKPSNQ